MAERIEIRRIQLRQDDRLAWLVNNPTLADGEMGIEKDTRQFKIGDGVTKWRDLEYGGLRGLPGIGATISTDSDNRAIIGTDGGLYVPELKIDPLEAYNQAKQ